MKLTNFHTHTCFCDGSSEPEEYVKAAIDLGFHSLGFSGHAPLPFRNRWCIDADEIEKYVSSIVSLKKKYRGKIDIYLGLEADYLPGIQTPFADLKKKYNLDYLIGAIHLVQEPQSGKWWFIDGSPENFDKGLQEIFNGNIRRAVECYFIQQNEMIITQQLDIIAHFDKIKMNNRNRYFSTDEPWFTEHIDHTIELIETSRKIVEVNTRGIYTKKYNELYPSVRILEKLSARNIPVTVSSDAHKPEELALEIPETLQLLKNLGFGGIMEFSGNKWIYRRW